MDLVTNKVRVVLGDLGFCTLFSSYEDIMNESKGTPYFFSPEIWFEARYGMKTDVWAMGCLAMYLFLNKYMIVYDVARGMN